MYAENKITSVLYVHKIPVLKHNMPVLDQEIPVLEGIAEIA